jgi:hypothetical protein
VPFAVETFNAKRESGRERATDNWVLGTGHCSFPVHALCKFRRASLTDFVNALALIRKSSNHACSMHVLIRFFSVKIRAYPWPLFPPLHHSCGIDRSRDPAYIRQTLKQPVQSIEFGNCQPQSEQSQVQTIFRPSPKGEVRMKTDWNTYRTRFLVRARQLTEPVRFLDPLGREHRGQPGDYLVESSDGFRRITPRQLFEDIYVAMHLTQTGQAVHSDEARHTAASTVHFKVSSPMAV